LDIGHTTCNVTGDLVGTVIVGSQMKFIDKDIYHGKNKVSAKKSSKEED